MQFVVHTFLVFAQTGSNNARGLEHTGLIFEFCSMKFLEKYTDNSQFCNSKALTKPEGMKNCQQLH